MWHQARAQERAIRSMMAERKKRIQKKQEFIAKMKTDPDQFLYVVGSRCKIAHIPAREYDAEERKNMTVWDGDGETMIDRFDGRAVLDAMSLISFNASNENSTTSVLDADENKEQLSSLQFERYRDIVEAQRYGLDNEDVLVTVENFDQKTLLRTLEERRVKELTTGDAAEADSLDVQKALTDAAVEKVAESQFGIDNFNATLEESLINETNSEAVRKELSTPWARRKAGVGKKKIRNRTTGRGEEWDEEEDSDVEDPHRENPRMRRGSPVFDRETRQEYRSRHRHERRGKEYITSFGDDHPTKDSVERANETEFFSTPSGGSSRAKMLQELKRSYNSESDDDSYGAKRFSTESARMDRSPSADRPSETASSPLDEEDTGVARPASKESAVEEKTLTASRNEVEKESRRNNTSEKRVRSYSRSRSRSRSRSQSNDHSRNIRSDHKYHRSSSSRGYRSRSRSRSHERRSRRRSRSRSPRRSSSRRSRSRSRSRDRHRDRKRYRSRSRSRDRHHRHRSYSRSRSRSRSPDRSRSSTNRGRSDMGALTKSSVKSPSVAASVDSVGSHNKGSSPASSRRRMLDADSDSDDDQVGPTVVMPGRARGSRGLCSGKRGRTIR